MNRLMHANTCCVFVMCIKSITTTTGFQVIRQQDVFYMWPSLCPQQHTCDPNSLFIGLFFTCSMSPTSSESRLLLWGLWLSTTACPTCRTLRTEPPRERYRTKEIPSPTSRDWYAIFVHCISMCNVQCSTCFTWLYAMYIYTICNSYILT